MGVNLNSKIVNLAVLSSQLPLITHLEESGWWRPIHGLRSDGGKTKTTFYQPTTKSPYATVRVNYK